MRDMRTLVALLKANTKVGDAYAAARPPKLLSALNFFQRAFFTLIFVTRNNDG